MSRIRTLAPPSSRMPAIFCPKNPAPERESVRGPLKYIQARLLTALLYHPHPLQSTMRTRVYGEGDRAGAPPTMRHTPSAAMLDEIMIRTSGVFHTRRDCICIWQSPELSSPLSPQEMLMKPDWLSSTRFPRHSATTFATGLESTPSCTPVLSCGAKCPFLSPRKPVRHTLSCPSLWPGYSSSSRVSGRFCQCGREEEEGCHCDVNVVNVVAKWWPSGVNVVSL
jgi:hypothetical protein